MSSKLILILNNGKALEVLNLYMMFNYVTLSEFCLFKACVSCN